MGSLFPRALVAAVLVGAISAQQVVYAQSDASDEGDPSSSAAVEQATPVNLVDRLRELRAEQDLANNIVLATPTPMGDSFDWTVQAGVNDQLVTATIRAGIYTKSGDVWLGLTQETRQAYVDSVIDALSAAFPDRTVAVEVAAAGRNGMAIQNGRMGTDGSRTYSGFN